MYNNNQKKKKKHMNKHIICQCLQLCHVVCRSVYEFVDLQLSVCLSICLLLSLFLYISSPMGTPSRGGGVSQLSLHTPFLPSLSALLPTGIFHLSFFSPTNFSRHNIIICNFLARTVLSVSAGLSPIFPFFYFFYFYFFYKSSFGHLSFCPWSSRGPARRSCAATRIVGGWDSGD